MTYTPSRPIMTAAELAASRHDSFGRNYRYSDDGYDDMEVAGRKGWRFLSSWGRDGWDLGEWPYVSIGVKDVQGYFYLMQICEGDHTVYEFPTATDRAAAIDYLFLWYGANKELDSFPLTYEQREQLDAGTLTVDDKWRGPFRREPELETVVVVDDVVVAVTRTVEL